MVDLQEVKGNGNPPGHDGTIHQGICRCFHECYIDSMLTIFVVSDATGETAERVVRSAFT
jgi:hypothetical protein